MFFDLHLAYFETSGLTEKWEFALRLKNLGILLVKLETLYKDVSKRSKIKAENKRKKTRWREDMNFMFEWQEQYLTSGRSLAMRT